ncbi:MAG: ral secretion pathway protein [Acidobacteriota bacterium]|nr:ral secretion pathway protein [Acidobacteriota bacterium]
MMNDERRTIMSETTLSVYFFNPVSGDIYPSEQDLPSKKSRLYLVINREQFFFRMFAIDSKKRMKDSHILNIQRHFIPFNDQFLNIIYSSEKQQEKKFFSWVGRSLVNVESYFYDEVPESLIFKGDPSLARNYRFFVFKRMTGFEIIYYNGADFYSLLEKDQSRIWANIITLIRKFSPTDTNKIKVLTEVDLGSLEGTGPAGENSAYGQYDISVDFIDSKSRHYFLPDHSPIKKKFSNISENKQLKSIKNIIRRWNRHLNIIIFLLLLSVLILAAGVVSFKKDNERFKEQFASVQNILSASEQVESRLNRIKQKIAAYPDHLLFLETIADSLGDDSMLTGYALEEGKIRIEGYSGNSLELLDRLRKSGLFQEVKFSSTVIKNVSSQREKFEIEIILKETVAP